MSGNEGVRELLGVLKSMENRLSRLESGQTMNRAPFFKSIKYPSPFLETSEKTLTDKGLQTITSMPVCSVCHKALVEAEYFCHHCQKLLCETCRLTVNNRPHCEDCVREFHIDISRRDYYVLVSLANGLKDINTISGICSETKENVKASVTTLLSSNLVAVDNKCFGLLYEYKLTEEGRVAIHVYRHVYGKHEDVLLFSRNLREVLFPDR